MTELLQMGVHVATQKTEQGNLLPMGGEADLYSSFQCTYYVLSIGHTTVNKAKTVPALMLLTTLYLLKDDESYLLC